jgi:putative protein-disulfide isomerase
MSATPFDTKPVGTLYYFGDPMCSWCWGFKPTLEQVEREYPELHRVTVMGGLRRGEEEPMQEPLVELIRGAWRRIEEATGQPFDHAFWDRHRPLQTTVPACKAVVAARTLDPAREWPYMVGMFQSYFTKLRDPSRRETHVAVAEETGFDPRAFEAALDSEPVQQSLQKDLDWAETLGIRGFPSLVLSVKDKYFLIAPGCQPIEALRKSINAVYEAHGIGFTRPESGLYS